MGSARAARPGMPVRGPERPAERSRALLSGLALPSPQRPAQSRTEPI